MSHGTEFCHLQPRLFRLDCIQSMTWLASRYCGSKGASQLLWDSYIVAGFLTTFSLAMQWYAKELRRRQLIGSQLPPLLAQLNLPVLPWKQGYLDATGKVNAIPVADMTSSAMCGVDFSDRPFIALHLTLEEDGKPISHAIETFFQRWIEDPNLWLTGRQPAGSSIFMQATFGRLHPASFSRFEALLRGQAIRPPTIQQQPRGSLRLRLYRPGDTATLSEPSAV